MKQPSTTGRASTAEELSDAVQLAMDRLRIQDVVPRSLRLSVEVWDLVSPWPTHVPITRNNPSISAYAGMRIYLDEALPPLMFEVTA